MKLDKIDDILSCVRLQWQRTPEKCGQLPAITDYELTPIDSIRGLVRIVCKNIFIQDIHKLLRRINVVKNVFELAEGWEADQFCVGRLLFQDTRSNPRVQVSRTTKKSSEEIS